MPYARTVAASWAQSRCRGRCGGPQGAARTVLLGFRGPSPSTLLALPNADVAELVSSPTFQRAAVAPTERALRRSSSLHNNHLSGSRDAGVYKRYGGRHRIGRGDPVWAAGAGGGSGRRAFAAILIGDQRASTIRSNCLWVRTVSCRGRGAASTRPCHCATLSWCVCRPGGS
jgi:hypothetical protein